MKKVSLSVLFIASAFAISAVEIALQPQRSLIVLPKQATSTQRYAALELQKHLAILSGVAIPIVDTPDPDTYLFHIGGQPAGAADALLLEEARWTVDTQAAWFHGEDTEAAAGFFKCQREPSFCLTLRRTGTLTAVYDFLENQFGVLWTEPGDAGIYFPEGARAVMQTGSGTWHPGAMRQRVMRSGMVKNVKQHNEDLPDPFQLNETEFERLRIDTHTWLKRQRMGNNMDARFGHAFTDWWSRYGDEHPEYFALVDGKRKPKYAPDRVKMCVSNPALHRQIVVDWQARKPLSEFINVCENDSGNYCECDACRALDMPPAPGQRWDEDLTDRYVYFANQVSALARAIKPDVTVCYYAYSVYRFPPQREKIAPGTLIGFVPGSVFDYAETAAMYDLWDAAGATRLFLRPNYQHVDCGLPMGFEKLYVELLKLGFEKGIIGSDFDSMHNFWPTSGMGDYMVARIMNNCELTYTQLLDEYSQIYGAAAPEFKAFKAYWQEEVCQKRLVPNSKIISERGRYGNFRRGLMWDLDKYYALEDFDRTDAILATGAEKELSSAARERLVRLQLANQHSRMTYQAIIATGDAKFSASRQLLNFRVTHRQVLNIDWRRLIVNIEGVFGDVAGVNSAWLFRDFQASRALPVRWKFKVDKNNVGLSEKWEQATVADVADWEPIRVTSAWEHQPYSEINPAFREKMKDYDGYGYYGLNLRIPKEWQGEEIHLVFSAVDESCWIYINGNLAGQHPCVNPNDWRTPFSIRIDQVIDWSKPGRSLVVRVHDSGGQGGIRKPVFLVKR
ncbi:MAG: DUF4838 domain-containing protein [Kiritimatiellia bacterium]